MQTFHKLKSGNYIFTQTTADGESSEGHESFTISLVKPQGQVLSHMSMLNGGHGLCSVVENECGQIDIYFTSDENKIYKTKYLAGTYDVLKGEGVEELPTFSTDRRLISINKEKDLVLFLNRNLENVYYCAYVYKFSDYINQDLKEPICTIQNVTIDSEVIQGYGVDENNVYLWFGGLGHVPHLRVYNIKEQKFYEYYYPNLAKKSSTENTIIECEGLQVTNDEVLVGVSFGDSATIRSNNIYTFSNIKNMEKNFQKVVEYI